MLKKYQIFDMLLPYMYGPLTELYIYVPLDLLATTDAFSGLRPFVLPGGFCSFVLSELINNVYMYNIYPVK